MADFNPAVALQTNAPDPNQGLQTLSKIMTLGSQGLGIRGQQSQNQSLAAKATIDTQTAKENQALAGLMSDPVGSGIVDGDGNVTKDAQKIILQSAPTTGSDHFQALTSAAKTKVEYNKSVNNLASDERAEIGNTLAGAAADPKASPETIKAALDGLVETKKGTPVYDDYKRIADTASHVVDHTSQAQLSQGKIIPPGQENYRQAALSMARPMLGAAGTVGPGGIATPQAAQVDNGGQIQPGTTAPPLAGGAFQPSGAPIQKVTPPTVTTNATGQLVRVAPGGAGASVVPTQAPPGSSPGQPQQNANPTQAQAIGQKDQATAVGQRVAQVQAQADSTVQAQDALNRARAIVESGQSPDTGTGFENKRAIANFLSSAGFDTKTSDNMNTLSKNLARYEASRATAIGLGGTDAARELAHSGSPNTQLDNKALQGILRQSLATEKILAGYANVQSKTNDPQQQIQNEVGLRAIPHPIETMEYTMSKNKDEAEAYLKEHGLTHADIAKSSAAMKQFGIM
jgi:hypothetical protein